MPRIHTYIAYCCREWIAPADYPGGRCGICDELPTYLREDEDCGCRECS